MAKRKTDEEKIVDWFAAADRSAATVMFRVIKSIVESKGGDTGTRKKSSKRPVTEKPLLTDASKAS
jgi:hypothetical protein